MSFETFPQYPPVDGELVDRIVCKLKSQGIFDQFRKDCQADVDTKPAYQNLQQRVNGSVATFLATQTWQQDLNKTQLRESLRRHVQQGFLEVGVDRIVDQVVNPKIFTVFMPKVEDIVYDCLGIEKPKHPPSSNNLVSGRKMTLVDLLPKDLDPVSPESDNLSFDDDETKDETNNNESSSKLDISHDSQVSGISDLSSHMGDSFKETQESHLDSNTVKSINSVKENSTEPHFENFENLSEKIKQAEIGGHNSVSSPLLEEQDNTESKAALEGEQNPLKDNQEDISMEIDSVSNSTFEDAKKFTNKIIKEDTCSRTMSEDSLSCSSFNSKFKKDKSKSIIVGTNENSFDKSEFDTPCKEISCDKEVKSSLTEDTDIKSEEKTTDSKEPRKVEELKDKKHRESSSKTNKSSRCSDSKHRSSTDKKDDMKQSKEKIYKEDKDKEKSYKDDKDKSSKYKDDRHYSSKDKYKDKDKNRDKDSDKKKDKLDYKEVSEKDKRNDKDQEKDRYKDKDKYDKEKTRNDKENHKYDKEKSRTEKDKDKHEKEKEKYDKDRHERSKRDKEKEKREKDKYESKEKDKDRNDKDRSRERERGKSEKDYKNEKDKESRLLEEKVKDDKKRDSKKYDKGSSSSSVKKDDNYKTEIKDRSKKSDEKTSNSKTSKHEEEKRDRKRKSERCNDEIKLKEARRSWDRDSSGGNGKANGSSKPNNSECKVSSSSSSTKEKRTGESSNQQKTNERKLESLSEADEPSDVDKILMKINSSIEESQNVQSNDEQAIKKPKIARNIFEIRKIMQARKNIARQASKQDRKRKELLESAEDIDVTDSTSATEPSSMGSPKIQEENKENIKAGAVDKMKNPKIGPMKGKFSGFLDSDIEQSRNSLQIFRTSFLNFCASRGMEVSPTENIEKIDYTKICDFSEELLDNNLNNLKPKSVSLERRKTYTDDSQVSKAVENIMSGKNGCYVLLQDCTEVVEAMRNAAESYTPQKQTDDKLNKSTYKPIHSKPQPDCDKDADSNRTSSEQNVKVLDHAPKKETLNSAVVRPVSQMFDCVVELGPEMTSHPPQQPVKQGNSAKKSAVRTTTPKADSKDEEAFSPVADLTFALNTYLNDSKEILPSVPLTEAMLDNLMKQSSSLIVEDETLLDSDDSIHGYENEKKSEVKEELTVENDSRILATSGDISDSSVYLVMPCDDSNDSVTRSKQITKMMDSSTCDIFTHNKDAYEEPSEIKTVKRRNQRLCRSASQRYDSTDLYKPRPVLPQNSKRIRTPRSVSSEDVSTRGQCESTPMKKRAR